MWCVYKQQGYWCASQCISQFASQFASQFIYISSACQQPYHAAVAPHAPWMHKAHPRPLAVGQQPQLRGDGVEAVPGVDAQHGQPKLAPGRRVGCASIGGDLRVGACGWVTCGWDKRHVGSINGAHNGGVVLHNTVPSCGQPGRWRCRVPAPAVEASRSCVCVSEAMRV